MQELSALLLDLFILFAAAKLAGEIFERLDQPAVIGELLAGMVIGPYALGLVGTPDPALVELFHGDRAAAQEAVTLVHHFLAELGVIVLLFFVGLETRAADLFRVGGRALAVGVLGIALPFVFGAAFMGMLGHPTLEALFVGTALVATSVGITARVLRDLGVIQSRTSRIILGAAVIDDILAMVLLAVVVGLAGTGDVSPLALALTVAQAIGFTLFLMLVGTGLMRRYSLRLEVLHMPDAPFSVAMLAMLGLAALSGRIGLAAIIGAFLAGMVFAEAKEHFELEHQALPVYQFLVPFFFVITGTQVDPRLFLQPELMALAAVITALAILGKVIGAGLAGLGLGARAMAILGVGMTPRGEVGLIVASIGRGLDVIPESIFSVVVIMSIVTTLIAPPILRLLHAGAPALPPEEEAMEQEGRLPSL